MSHKGIWGRDRQELKVSKFESGFERYISVCINWIFWIFQIIAVFKSMKVSECVEMIDFFEISHVRTCWIFLKNYKFCRECFFSIVLNFQQVTFFVLFFFFVYCFFAVKSKFFEKFVLTHQVVDFHHLPNFSSGCQLSSPSELFIRLLTFITFQSFHQVVDFHHFPNFSSGCRLSSLSEVFINFKLCISLPLCWDFSKQKVVRWFWGDILFTQKQQKYFEKRERKWFKQKSFFLLLTAASGVKENIWSRQLYKPPYQQAILQCTILLFTFECYWVDHKSE